MSGTEPNDEDMMRAGEYALGLLSAEDAEAFERDMRADAALRARYVRWAEEFAGLADEVEPVMPPRRVKDAIKADLFGSEPKRSVMGWLIGWHGALAAVAVLLALLFVTDFMQTVQPAPSLVAEIAAEDGALVIAAAYADSGEMTLVRRAGEARPGRALELWLIEGGNPPVSLGVLPATKVEQLTVPEALRARMSTAVLAVSDEPLGGSTTGAPTGDVLAVGQVSRI